MKLKLILIVLFTFSLLHISKGQLKTYTVKKAAFSSDLYDEYSPVYYKNGIVFCTNRNLSLSNYTTSKDKGLFEIYFIDTTGKVTWQNARLFSKSLKTNLNDGPVTFNSTGDTIFYSRNLEVSNNQGSVSSTNNRLGIFSAVLAAGEWSKIRAFRINNEWYSVTTPWLSADGKRLYFASDKPGGFGGSDLYYTQWGEDYWNDPVNLGPIINTKGNEAYPFINPAGELFFSSDGHGGLGGKDIFFSRMKDGNWLPPLRLDAPVNSEFDDFGLITDTLIREGYFSSNRDKSIDIFHFRTNFPQVFYSTMQRENQYCFTFKDTGSIPVDTLNIRYLWNFGDGKKAFGDNVNHCFPGPGKFNIKLDLVDRVTGDLFFSKLSYDLELRDIEQPYINSYGVSIKGDSIEFDALKSYLPGNKIINISWDFGDGYREQGENVKHSFNEKGEYMVNLGLTLKDDSTGKILKTGTSKKIIVLDDLQEIAAYLEENASLTPEFVEITKYDNAIITPLYSSETKFKEDAIFQVQLFSSVLKVEGNSNYFLKVPKKYFIHEAYNSDEGTYSYFVDNQMKLMDTYIAYKELADSGYNEVRIKIENLKDPAEKELNVLKKIFGVSTDAYFDSYNRLTPSAYLLLDQIVKIMNKYPEIKIEAGVHTDNTETPKAKLYLSQVYAKTITDYLTSKGIDPKRLIGKGFGGTRPVSRNSTEEERKWNRRIDFTILKQPLIQGVTSQNKK
jgi:outer membrane protein OmpA-like peptidoglycan-associated protein